jgi:hypothetical protein
MNAAPELLAAIVLVPDRLATIRALLAALASQTAARRLEIVFAGPSAVHTEITAELMAPFAGWRFVPQDPFTTTCAARAAAIRATTAPWVVLTEDHSLPRHEWAQQLISRLETGCDVVGPAVENGNPRHLGSWLNLLIEYGDWLAPHPGGPLPHLPGHNSAYRRDLLLALGSSLAQQLEAESVLHWQFLREGRSLWLEPRAITRHQNFERLLPSLRLRLVGGRLFAANRSAAWSWPLRIAWALAFPLIALRRTARVAANARRVRPTAWLGLVPALFAFLLVDALGEALGYLAGAGRSMDYISDIDFKRHRYFYRRGPADVGAPAA